MPSTPARKKSVTIDREWLKTDGTLRIDDKTSDVKITSFAANVSGITNDTLAIAVGEIVAQAKSELAAIKGEGTKYALLVCMPYYMKWRGKRAISARPRAKTSRHGLFLVRPCVRCKKANESVAVFRVNAYRTGDGASKPGRYAYHKRSEKTTAHLTCGIGDKRKEHNAQEPWSCACCKHLYCTDPTHGAGHARAGHPLKATCGGCKENKWRKRSKSKRNPGKFIEGDAGKRKEESSYYEPIRKGMYFTDAAFTAANEISKALVITYNADDPNATASATTTSDAEPVATRTRSRAAQTPMSSDNSNATASASTSEPELRAPGKRRRRAAPVEPESANAAGAFAQTIVPKITLIALAPIRHSSRGGPVVGASFGRFV